jgi:5'-nucleotidase
MHRRSFLRNFSLAGMALTVHPIIAKNNKSNRRLVILHTNDTHSNIDPFPANHAKFPGLGGVVKRHALIQQIRSENDHVLLFDSGDIFQGTPYFNTFKGELELKVMSEMGYDAATMGNHDFDIGLEGFLNAQQYANFPFVCSNYDFSKTILQGKTLPYKIFKKAGIKIGVFGIGVDLKGLVPEKLYGETVYLEPIETANQTAEILQKNGADLVICLSHLGYSYADDARVSDLFLAKKTKGIDLILGGHTHTFLEEATVLNNLENQPVLINQVGWGGVYVGQMVFDIERGVFSNKKHTVK